MSVSEAVAADHTGHAFVELVRNEMGATWHGRCRWLWIVGALLVEALIIGLYAPPINGIHAVQGAVTRMGSGPEAFYVLMFCIFWPPMLMWTGAAALGADLLSLQYRENPEPHRQWPPREFLARPVGRLAPWFVWSAVWLSTWIMLEFWASHVGRISVSPRTPVLPVPPMSTWHEAVDLGLALWLFALPFAAVAALLSAASRRPRRGRLTVATWIMILLLGVADQVLAFQLSALDFRSGLLYDRLLWVAETVAAVGAVWWIARERYRRHPYTAVVEAKGQPSAIQPLSTATTESSGA